MASRPNSMSMIHARLREIEDALRNLWETNQPGEQHLLADNYLAAALQLAADALPEPVCRRLQIILFLYNSLDKFYEDEASGERPADGAMEGVPGPPDG